MNRVIKILMKRDNLTYGEANEAYLECREAMLEAIEEGGIFEAEEILRGELGLEPDYIFDII